MLLTIFQDYSVPPVMASVWIQGRLVDGRRLLATLWGRSHNQLSCQRGLRDNCQRVAHDHVLIGQRVLTNLWCWGQPFCNTSEEHRNYISNSRSTPSFWEYQWFPPDHCLLYCITFGISQSRETIFFLYADWSVLLNVIVFYNFANFTDGGMISLLAVR
jgi:hypothetical protein